jgi:hypothetical protein
MPSGMSISGHSRHSRHGACAFTGNTNSDPATAITCDVRMCLPCQNCTLPRATGATTSGGLIFALIGRQQRSTGIE